MFIVFLVEEVMEDEGRIFLRVHHQEKVAWRCILIYQDINLTLS